MKWEPGPHFTELRQYLAVVVSAAAPRLTAHESVDPALDQFFLTFRPANTLAAPQRAVLDILMHMSQPPYSLSRPFATLNWNVTNRKRVESNY